MRASNLDSLRGYITNGAQLRTQAARAISQVEVYAKRASALPPAVAVLKAFFLDAIDKIDAVGDYPVSIDASAADVALSLASDTTEQISVTATQLDGGTASVTVQCVYSSSNAAVATVSASGLITAVAVGSAVITVQFQNRTDTIAVTVAA